MTIKTISSTLRIPPGADRLFAPRGLRDLGLALTQLALLFVAAGFALA